MQVLIAGLVAAVILLLLPRFLGRRQERMLKQYLLLEKLFGLTRRVSQSRWGKGIGEHYSLHGESRGYPLSLYGHFKKEDGIKVEWTSLVFETLFAEGLELCIEFAGTDPGARFSRSETLVLQGSDAGSTIWTNDDAVANRLNEEAIAKRIRSFAGKPVCGAVRLSKGFIEYRELGVMIDEPQRERFQEAILLLGAISDMLSLYASERRQGEAVQSR